MLGIISVPVAANNPSLLEVILLQPLSAGRGWGSIA